MNLLQIRRKSREKVEQLPPPTYGGRQRCRSGVQSLFHDRSFPGEVPMLLVKGIIQKDKYGFIELIFGDSFILNKIADRAPRAKRDQDLNWSSLSGY